jgi:hypothetical protein
LAQRVLRHSVLDGDPAAIFDRALTLLLTELRKKTLAYSDATEKKGRESSRDSRPFRPGGASRSADTRYDPEGGFLPLVATKLTQSPWFLNTPKVFQPPFLHWSVDVGSGATNSILATKASESPAWVV